MSGPVTDQDALTDELQRVYREHFLMEPGKCLCGGWSTGSGAHSAHVAEWQADAVAARVAQVTADRDDLRESIKVWRMMVDVHQRGEDEARAERDALVEKVRVLADEWLDIAPDDMERRSRAFAECRSDLLAVLDG